MKTLLFIASFFILNSLLFAQTEEMTTPKPPFLRGNNEVPFFKQEQHLSKMQKKPHGDEVQGIDKLYLVEQIFLYSNYYGNERHTYSYGIKGELLSVLSEKFDNGQWKYYHKYSYGYNINGFISFDLYEIWIEGEWVKFRKNDYNYDSNNNMVLQLVGVLSNGNFSNGGRTICTYDSNGNMLTALTESRDDMGNWISKYRYTYTYDSENRMILNVYEINLEEYHMWHWVNNSKISLTYDANGNKISQLNEYWKHTGEVQTEGHWEIGSRNTYNYNNNLNLISDLEEGLSNGKWMNIERKSYIFNIKGNIESELWENWDNNQWKNNYFYTYKNDTMGNVIKVTYNGWFNDKWIDNDESHLHFTDAQKKNYYFEHAAYKLEVTYKQIETNVNDLEQSNIHLFINPNPANDFLNISYSVQFPAELSFTITNSLGIEIAKFNENNLYEKGENNIQYNIEGLSSGIYFLNMKAGRLNKTVKFMIVK
jgi:hypothetical protein